MGGVVRGFDAVTQDAQARVRVADVIHDPAPAAVRLVASRLRTGAAAGDAGRPGRSIDPVHRIALNSGMRTRSVRLEEAGGQDIGPMIGRRKAGNEPVALLRPPRLRRRVHRSGRSNVVPVTGELSAQLDNKADVLYAPLPERVRGVGALLRFGERGNRRDLVGCCWPARSWPGSACSSRS